MNNIKEFNSVHFGGFLRASCIVPAGKGASWHSEKLKRIPKKVAANGAFGNIDVSRDY